MTEKLLKFHDARDNRLSGIYSDKQIFSFILLPVVLILKYSKFCICLHFISLAGVSSERASTQPPQRLRSYVDPEGNYFPQIM